MSSRQNPFTGRSGQMAVAAQFLKRGYNVAVPEVDRGDDLYVVDETSGELARVQVKASLARGKKMLAGAFNLSMAQLQRPHHPELYYVLAFYREGLWRDFLVIPRPDLYRLRTIENIGHITDGGRRLVLHVSLRRGEANCGKVSLSQYLEEWSRWPEIRH
ncbi:MAG TPA: hypothetical protein VFI31_21195 [Pirellulales bacterium]|nr:hypothetical protein [Pirellulales bacterium]